MLTTNRKKYLVKKLIDIGIPYLVFTVATYYLKNTFSGFVNEPVTDNLVYIIMLKPIQHYWFLYCLLIMFVLPSIENNKTVIYYLAFFLMLKIIGDMNLLQIGIFNKLFSNIFWFALGMIVKKITIIKKIPKIIGYIFLALFVILSISLIPCNNIIFSFLMTFLSIASLSLIEYNSNKAAIIAKYVFPIYLLHTFFCAGARILLRFITINPLIHILIDFLCSLFCPIITVKILSMVGLDFVIFPYKIVNLLHKRKNKIC